MHMGDLKHVKGVATVMGECKERSESRRAGFGVQVKLTRKGREKINI